MPFDRIIHMIQEMYPPATITFERVGGLSNRGKKRQKTKTQVRLISWAVVSGNLAPTFPHN
jgi:hypothetical protein